MKKNIYIGLSIFLTLTFFSSCSDWLNIFPEDDIVEEKYWENKYQVESVMLSSYRFMTAGGFMERVIQWGEMRSDNVATASNANVNETRISDFNILFDNPICKWDEFYKVINICNLVLEKAPLVQQADINFRDEELRSYQAEAMTIRALCYFYLVRTFGEVPWVEESSKSDAQDFNVPQSSEEVILNHLITDLNQAEEFARSQWTTVAQSKGRITKNAVRALLADIYLWKGEYTAAESACDRVLNDPLTSETLLLEKSPNYTWFYNVFYQGNSQESIFELNFSITGERNNTTRNLYGNTETGSRAHLAISATLGSAYDPVYDFRGLFFMEALEAGSPIFKYEGRIPVSDFAERGRNRYRYRPSNSTSNWIFYRLPDIYLMKAEAQLRQNPSSDTELKNILSLINRTYTRATVDADSLLFSNYPDRDRIKTALLEERRREFAFEGKRWFDLMRKVKQDGSTAGAWGLLEAKFTENVTLIKNKLSMFEAWYLPIHQDQMNINKHLHQNEFYKYQE